MAVHAALGQPVQDLPSMLAFYLVFDLVALLLLGSAAWDLQRAVRAAESPTRSWHPTRGRAGVLVRTSTARPRPPKGNVTMYPLEIEHVTKRYGREVVVDDLTFTVAPGRVTGFLGPNGAGKSTTMKILLDLASADSGQATIAGARYRDLKDPARAVGVVLEPNAFHPGRSGRNHLRILADGAGLPPDRVDAMLEAVDLTHAAERRVGAYSLGMRQRLGIAAALLGDPPVLVLDEPGNGLDPQGIRWLRDLLRVRAAAGGTVFVSSHLLAEVEHLADEVVVLSRGQLVATGALATLQRTGTSLSTPSPAPLTRLLRAAGATVHEGIDGHLIVRGLPMADIGDRACAAGIALHELARQAGSLEELFLDWTSNGADTAEVAETERQAVPR
jgi:ABC-2 type transport system ATP-binding protein